MIFIKLNLKMDGLYRVKSKVHLMLQRIDKAE